MVAIDARHAGDINLQFDIETGLYGPVVVYPEGKLESTIAKHPEFIIYYSTTDESNSWYTNKNIQKFLPDQYDPRQVRPAVVTPTIQANASIWGPVNADIPLTGLSTFSSQPSLTPGVFMNR